MTDKERVNGYIESKWSSLIAGTQHMLSEAYLAGLEEGRRDSIKAYLAGIKGGRKDRNCVSCSNNLRRENAELKEKLKGFESGDVAWQGDMDATIKQNLELKETVSRAGYRIAELKHEIDELKAHCKAVDDVNSKMKCCGNCKLGAHGSALCRTCYDYRNWELID